MGNDNTINCPACGAEINVSDVIYHQIEEKISKNFAEKNEKKERELEKKFHELEKEKEGLQQRINEAVKSKLTEERLKLEESIRKSIKEETIDQIESLNKQLEQKSKQIRELNKIHAEMEKLKREKDELKGEIELQKEKEFSERLKDERMKIKKQVDEAYFLRIRELEKQLADQRNLAEEMKRKAEQGSMQLQGETQELAIEEILKSFFPFDQISKVGKGIKGADVIQTVRNKFGNNCGTILYESKRTKSFSNEWIPKLKADAVDIKADICVIVTEALPDGIDRIGQKDGVWICTLNDLKGLALVLRESLIKINEAYSFQTNKGEKMQMLYDYLTSREFILQVNAIIEGFTNLQNSYMQEKRAMEKIWKEREKQLERILLNTNHFIGSIKGIAGSSIPDLKQIGPGDNILELGQ